MKTTQELRRSAALFAALTVILAAPVLAGGFSIFEQGARAMAMSGAFAAQADDPSTLFYNVGGLAFFEQREIAVGITLVTSHDEQFVGTPPGIAQGTTGSLVSLEEPLPHLYWVQPIGRSWNFGLAVNSPFGLKSEWEDPDSFSGRYINTNASMLVIDLNPNLGVKLTDNVGIGFGAIIRMSELEFNQRLPSFDPASGGVVDIASTRLESDMDQGIGWQAGLLHRYNNSFSWGLSYRSRLTVDYGGSSVFTQIPTGNPALDALVSATVPFDQPLPVATSIEFPDLASLGIAMALGPTSVLELDANWSGWSSFDTLDITFANNPEFDLSRNENWADSYSYRFGLRFGSETGSEWMLGFATDESPQPSGSVSPLLPDADRDSYSAGWSGRLGATQLDLSVLYLDFDSRSVADSMDAFNGTYSQTGWLFAATFGF